MNPSPDSLHRIAARRARACREAAQLRRAAIDDFWRGVGRAAFALAGWAWRALQRAGAAAAPAASEPRAHPAPRALR